MAVEEPQAAREKSIVSVKKIVIIFFIYIVILLMSVFSCDNALAVYHTKI